MKPPNTFVFRSHPFISSLRREKYPVRKLVGIGGFAKKLSIAGWMKGPLSVTIPNPIHLIKTKNKIMKRNNRQTISMERKLNKGTP